MSLPLNSKALMENEGNSAALLMPIRAHWAAASCFRLPTIRPPAQEIRQDAYGYIQRNKDGQVPPRMALPLRKRFPRCGHEDAASAAPGAV